MVDRAGRRANASARRRLLPRLLHHRAGARRAARRRSASQPWPTRSGAAFVEVARRHGDFALVGRAAALAIGDDGAVRRRGIAVAGVATEPVSRAVVDGAGRRRQPAAAGSRSWPRRVRRGPRTTRATCTAPPSTAANSPRRARPRGRPAVARRAHRWRRACRRRHDRVTVTVNGTRYERTVAARPLPGRLPARRPRPHRHPRRAASTASAAPAPCCSTASPCARASCSRSRPTARELTTVEGLARSADGAAPAAAGVPRAPRPPVRLLHAGLPDDHHRLPAREHPRPTTARSARRSPATSAAAPATRTSSRAVQAADQAWER